MAKRVIAIGGVPATGKTTLMRKLIKDLMPLSTFKYKLVNGLYNRKKNIYIIGIYNEELFSGTDKLSMAVQPNFVELTKKVRGGTFLFEGDRLFNQSLFEQVNCEKIILEVEEEIIEQRHISRNDTQSDQFKKSKRTKIQNIADKFNVTILKNNTKEESEHAFNYIKNLIEK